MLRVKIVIAAALLTVGCSSDGFIVQSEVDKAAVKCEEHDGVSFINISDRGSVVGRYKLAGVECRNGAYFNKSEVNSILKATPVK